MVGGTKVMKIQMFIYAVVLSCITFSLSAIEVTAGRVSDLGSVRSLSLKLAKITDLYEEEEVRLSAIKQCNAQLMFYAPSNPESNANGCFKQPFGEVQIGTVNGLSRTTTISVTFPEPFDGVPDVFTAVTSYDYSDNCEGFKTQRKALVTNVTSTGFDLTVYRRGTCGGSQHTNQVMWVAATQ